MVLWWVNSMTSDRVCICADQLDAFGKTMSNRTPEGKPIHVTVGCRVHHLMPDGEPAADHEVSCACSNFVDDRNCDTYLDDDGAPHFVCRDTGCGPVLVKDCGFVPAPVGGGLCGE